MKTFKAVSLVSLFLGMQVFSATYYVKPGGNDSNNGLSIANAWQTITKVNSINFSAGDQILFEGGSSFSGSLSFDNNDAGSETNPIIVSSYGTGHAVINGGSGNGCYVYNTAGMEIRKINFTGTGSNNGIFLKMDVPNNAKLKHIYIDQCEISGFQSGIAIAGFGSLSGYLSGYDDVRITNCSIHGNVTSGIVSWGATWTGGVNHCHRNLYIADCVVYDNSGAGTNSGSGINISGMDNGIIEYCEAYNNGHANTGTDAGPVGIWLYRSDNILIQYCISHNNETGPNNWDGGGFDFDGGCTNCTLQYNYSYENEGPGYLLCQFSGASPWNNNTVRYNISENDGRKNSVGAVNFWNGDVNPVKGARVYNNIIWVSKGKVISGNPSCVRVQTGSMSNNVLYNNIFIAADGLKLLDIPSQTANFTFCNNLYWTTGAFNINWSGTTYNSLTSWRTATSQEKLNGNNKGIQADPKLINPGNGEKTLTPRSLANLTAYKQQSSSPCKDAGLDLQAVFGIIPGLKDFWGNTIPQGAGYDLGAHETVGSVNQLLINLNSPIGGEEWTVGSQQHISWTCSDNVGITSRTIFARQGSLPWALLDSALCSTGAGNWQWNVPSQVSDSVSIKITVYNILGNSASDSSDVFSIVSSPRISMLPAVVAPILPGVSTRMGPSGITFIVDVEKNSHLSLRAYP